MLGNQFKDLLMELNQDTQDEHFNCQEECSTLEEEYNHSNSYKATFRYYPLLYTHNNQKVTTG